MKTIKNNKQMIFALLVFFNIALTVISLASTLQISSIFFPIELQNTVLSLSVYFVISAVFLICLFSFKVISLQRKAKNDLFLELIKANSVAGTALVVLSLATNGIYFSVVFAILFTVNNLWLLFLLNAYMPKLITRILFGGFQFRNIVLVGGREMEKFIDEISENHKYIYNILFIITSSNTIRNKYSDKFKIYPSHASIESLIQYDVVDEVISFDDILSIEAIEKLADCCYEENITFYVNTSEKDQLYKHNTIEETICNTPFYVIKNTHKDTSSVIGNIYEIIVTTFLLFFLSPIMLIISTMLWLAHQKQPIIKQKSIGLHGRKFYCYGYRLSKSPEEKISLLGHFLVSTQLNRLPQLFNVIKGDMSLIGPKPAMISDFEKKANWFRKQKEAFHIKPGIAALQKVHT